MRILAWFTAGFAAAVATGVYLVSGWYFLIPVALGLLVIIALLAIHNKAWRIVATVTVGFFIGAVCLYAFSELHLDEIKTYDGKTVTAIVRVVDYSYETDYGVAFDGEILLDDTKYQAKVYTQQLPQLQPGDTVTGEFRLRMTTADAVQGATFHQGDGVFLLAYGRDEIKVSAAENIQLQDYPAHLRKAITDLLDDLFPGDTAAFARALLLGDSSLLDYETDTSFKVSGIRHVIAVSGLHVSILFALVYLLSGKRRVLTAILGIPVLLLFAAVAGFTPSVTRACIMQCLMILALLLKKEYDPPTALAFAVLVMLTVNPMVITSVSFQLSVGCLVGILMFYQRTNAYLLRLLKTPKGKTLRARLSRWIAGSVSITFSAMVFTTPLIAVYFGAVSIVGVLTNLLVLWVVSLIFYGIMLTCVLGAVWHFAGEAVAWLISWLIRYVKLVSRILAALPMSAVYTCSVFIVVWLILCYLLFAVFLGSKKKRPALLLSCVAVSLCVALLLSWVEPRLDSYRVTVFDVGQGQAILIQSGNENYLVDCGGENEKTVADQVAEKLLSQGITQLDGVFLTHYDADHAAGTRLLLSRVNAQKLYLPDITADHPIRRELEAQFKSKISWIGVDSVFSTNHTRISLYPSQNKSDSNESCMCILFQMEKCDILITGDLGMAGERKLVERIDLPKLEILVAGHHGSNNSTGLELLAETQPENVVISVGRDNDYGHPHEQVLRRLAMAGSRVWRTDQQGTILLRR